LRWRDTHSDGRGRRIRAMVGATERWLWFANISSSRRFGNVWSSEEDLDALTAELVEAVQQVFPGCCMWFPAAPS
jgi:hypothetical protein